MSTPVINVIDNVNQTSLNGLFTAVANNAAARESLSQSDRNIDKVSTNVGVIESLNSNEAAIRAILCRREGRDPANFATLDAVAAGQALMQDVAARQQSSKVLARSQKASAAVAASQTAMEEVADSQTAMQEVAASQAAMIEIGNSATARPEVFASGTALSEIRSVDQAIAKLSAGESGLDAANFPDMATLAADGAAMQAVVASQAAMQEVADSQAAMQEVAASQTAMEVVGNNSIAQNTVYNNNTAISELESSPLKEFESVNDFRRQGSVTLRNDRVILISHGAGSRGIRVNQPQFGANSDDLPHTADRVRRTTNTFNNARTNTQATFIDISG
jgi:hypothetical protein